MCASFSSVLLCGLPALLLLLLVGLAVPTAAAPQLKRLFVLHRHGAREPLGVVNDESLICHRPFCELTNEGKAMLLSLGNHLAATYKDALGIPDPYNVSFITSNATDYARVAISAEAVVMGMFADQNPLPFVDFFPKTQDLQLVPWESWPTWKLRRTYGLEVNVDDEWVRETIGFDNMTKIANYFGIPNLCAVTPTDCINYAQDVLACNISAGITPPEWLLDLWPRFRVVVARFLSRALGYNPTTSDYSSSIGAYGYPLASTALQFLAQRTSSGTHQDLMRMYHIGAHDWTLFTLFTALGSWTPQVRDDEQWVVQFGEAVILEVYEDTATGMRSINALRGSPTQAPGQHTYNFSGLTIQCKRADGSIYAAVSCPLDELWRFVNTTAPQSPDGVCYATADMLAEQSCDGNNAPPVGSACLFYRQNCPSQPCGSVPGGIVDPARGYMCQTAQLGKGTPFVVATMVALMAPSLLAGAIAGFYGANKIKALLWRRTTDDAEERPFAPN